MSKLLDQMSFYPKCVSAADFNQDNMLDITACNA